MDSGPIGQVLLAALLLRERWITELVLAELHRKRAGVVLDGRDVVDCLPKTFVHEPPKGGLLDVDQVGEVETCFRRENCAGEAQQPLYSMMKPPLKTARGDVEKQADSRRPEPASLPKQDKPAQGPGSPWRSHGSVATCRWVTPGRFSRKLRFFASGRKGAASWRPLVFQLVRSYLTSTAAPASSSWALIESASSWGTPSLTGLGAPSTRSWPP